MERADFLSSRTARVQKVNRNENNIHADATHYIHNLVNLRLRRLRVSQVD
jgi:hypothetical protein